MTTPDPLRAALERLDRAIAWAENQGPKGKATVFGPGDVSYDWQPVTVRYEDATELRAALAADTAPLDVEPRSGCDCPDDRCASYGPGKACWPRLAKERDQG